MCNNCINAYYCYCSEDETADEFSSVCSDNGFINFTCSRDDTFNRFCIQCLLYEKFFKAVRDKCFDGVRPLLEQYWDIPVYPRYETETYTPIDEDDIPF